MCFSQLLFILQQYLTILFSSPRARIFLPKRIGGKIFSELFESLEKATNPMDLDKFGLLFLPPTPVIYEKLLPHALSHDTYERWGEVQSGRASRKTG